MRIIFVAGPAFSGKSIFINKQFPDAVQVKISTFNRHVYEAQSNEEIAKINENAQYYCRMDLQNRIRALKENEVLVFEHNLLKKEIRAFYIDAVKAVTDTPIECIVMWPTDEIVDKILNHEKQLIHFHEYEKGKMEMPEISEGFESVMIVNPIFSEADYKGLHA